jgi:hypothetical protein
MNTKTVKGVRMMEKIKRLFNRTPALLLLFIFGVRGAVSHPLTAL